MTAEVAATLAGLGLLGAFVSDLPGIAGAIVMTPLLLSCVASLSGVIAPPASPRPAADAAHAGAHCGGW